MAQENIMFRDLSEGSYHIADLYFMLTSYYEYEDSYKYYDIDVDKILSYKKVDNKYVIRYNLNRMKIAPLQLKIKNFSGKLSTFTNNDRVMFIYTNDKEVFKKCREIWNKITELIVTNNAPDFVKTNSDDDEIIIANVHENTSFVEGNYENEVVIFLDSVFNDYPQTLIQVKTKKKCIKKINIENDVNKKYIINTLIPKCFTFFFNI